MKSNMTIYVADVELDAEELEEVIAPALTPNHNETVEIDLGVEELEEVVAPSTINHNETLASDEVSLDVEEVEEVIAPGTSIQHNETLLND